jgi:hypothetical protein
MGEVAGLALYHMRRKRRRLREGLEEMNSRSLAPAKRLRFDGHVAGSRESAIDLVSSRNTIETCEAIADIILVAGSQPRLWGCCWFQVEPLLARSRRSLATVAPSTRSRLWSVGCGRRLHSIAGVKTFQKMLIFFDFFWEGGRRGGLSVMSCRRRWQTNILKY